MLSTQPAARPSAPPPDPRSRLIERLCNASTYSSRHELVATLSQKQFNKAKETLGEAKKIEKAIQSKTTSDNALLKQLVTKKAEIAEARAKLDQLLGQALVGPLAQTNAEITEATAFSYIKPLTIYHAAWLLAENKKLALEDCIFQLSRAFEAKLVTLEEYLTSIRKLSGKIFRCVYKQTRLDQQYIQT